MAATAAFDRTHSAPRHAPGAYVAAGFYTLLEGFAREGGDKTLAANAWELGGAGPADRNGHGHGGWLQWLGKATDETIEQVGQLVAERFRCVRFARHDSLQGDGIEPCLNRAGGWDSGVQYR